MTVGELIRSLSQFGERKKVVMTDQEGSSIHISFILEIPCDDSIVLICKKVSSHATDAVD